MRRQRRRQRTALLRVRRTRRYVSEALTVYIETDMGSYVAHDATSFWVVHGNYAAAVGREGVRDVTVAHPRRESNGFLGVDLLALPR